MREDKKLQKKIKQEFETPEIPFEEWAAQNGISTDAPERVKCPVLEPADNVNGKGIPNGNKKKILSVCLPLFAVLVALAILLGCFLPKSSPVPPPKIYGANDATKKDIYLQEIVEQEDFYLFDMSAVARTEEVNKDVLIEDESQVLLYTMRNCLLSVSNGESFDGFYITYRIRLYPRYEFMGSEYFSELSRITVQDKAIEYRIRDLDQPAGYAKFSDGTYEYFIEARGYPNVTVLNEQNFLNLLNEILI